MAERFQKDFQKEKSRDSGNGEGGGSGDEEIKKGKELKLIMADTRIQIEVEDWVRRNWMAQQFGQKFYRERLPLSSGGVFDFDAVSEDHKMVATISTSGSKTVTGRHAVGKLLKIRSDMFFLLLVNAERRLVILTEPDMFELCQKETEGGRVPSSIKFLCAQIPDDLAVRLRSARQVASKEVSPSNK